MNYILARREGVEASLAALRALSDVVVDRLENRKPTETASPGELMTLFAATSLCIAEVTKLLDPPGLNS